MAMLMNIAGTTPVEDPEYRYKMPRLVGKVEGRGNGIKTAIPNMTQVASSLHRPPGEVTKFFGCELGAQTTWTDETERAIVNGAHATNVLQDKLTIYIEKFVLCPSCRLPETSYKIKNEIIYHQCVACGAREAVDMQHKLTTYILKSYKLDKKKDGKKKASGDKKKKDKKDLTDAEKAERKRKKKAEKEAAAAAENGNDDVDDDEEPEEDVDDTGAMDSAVNGLKAFMMKSPEPDAAVSEVRAVQTFCALPRNERAFILCAALLPDNAALDPTPNALAILAAFKVDSGADALILGLEKLAAIAYPGLAPKFAIILKKLYDADVLDEQAILAWYDAGCDLPNKEHVQPSALSDDLRAALLKHTDPFITWLKEADEEDDDDDDDEG